MDHQHTLDRLEGKRPLQNLRLKFAFTWHIGGIFTSRVFLLSTVAKIRGYLTVQS